MSESLAFYGFPLHYFYGKYLPSVGGLTLDRYPLPKEIGLVNDSLSP